MSESPTRTPNTPQEWQESVWLADLCLRLELARDYGMIEGGPIIDIERCKAILQQGAKLGYHPPQR